MAQTVYELFHWVTSHLVVPLPTLKQASTCSIYKINLYFFHTSAMYPLKLDDVFVRPINSAIYIERYILL